MIVFSESAVSDPANVASRLGVDFLVAKDTLTEISESDRDGTRVLWIRFTSLITDAVLETFKNLEIVVTTTTGLTHLAIPDIRRRGIEVVSLSSPNTAAIDDVTATAEHAWALIQDAQYPVANRAYAWSNRASSLGHFERIRQLSGQTLGIIGFGRLGRKVATFGAAFGMRVIAVDPFARWHSPDVDFVDNLPRLISEADVVSLHASFEDGSEPIITDLTLRPGNPKLVLVNTARAELVDERAILCALDEKRLSVYTADVFEGDFDDTAGGVLKQSWFEKTYESRLRLTPHVAGSCLESYSKVEEVLISRVRSKMMSRKLLP